MSNYLKPKPSFPINLSQKFLEEESKDYLLGELNEKSIDYRPNNFPEINSFLFFNKIFNDCHFISSCPSIENLNENSYNLLSDNQLDINLDKNFFEIEKSFSSEIINNKKERSNPNEKKKINKKIFSVKKIRKIKKHQPKGRYVKNSGKIGKHNRFSRDNIIRKFKSHFIKSVYEYINSKFLVNKNRPKEKMKKVLLKINPNQGRQMDRNRNIEWLEYKWKKVFSDNVSLVFSKKRADYNEKKISKIYREGKEKEVIELLEMSVQNMLNKYRDLDNIEGFRQMKDIVNELREKNEDEKYIKEYLYVGNSFEYIFNSVIKTRNLKNNTKNKIKIL